MSGETTIGIDLGTRYAQLAIDVPGSGVHLIPNRWGQMRTQSVVSFTKDGLVAGEDAAKISLVDTRSVWWDMKRHLGTDWVARMNGRTYTPEELLLPLLCLLREDAEAHLKTFVSSCVLAVPAHFSFPERGALARAAQQAGFERVRIVNEPTAAALTIGAEGLSLIIDFGAGTLDLSVVEGDRGVFQVVESQGRRDIGGMDIDRLLAELLCRRAGVPFSRYEDPRANLMMREAEAIKISLSGASRVQWRIPPGIGTKDTLVDISRGDLERLIAPLMGEVVRMVDKMWRKYGPHRLLIVGGSGRIPMLRRMLTERVHDPERLRSSPEEAVVVGSAMYANQGKERLLIDVLSRSLGVMGADGGVVPILHRGIPLPAEARKTFTTYGKGDLEVTVVQGDGRVRSLNRVLQTIKIDRVGDGESVEVVFKVDGGGLLHVEVKRKRQALRQTITLENDEAGVTPCDLLTEIGIREERLARVSSPFPDNFQHRLQILMREVRSLKLEDHALQWQALEVIDKMIREIEQVVLP
ncbi:MAG: Hsp70 family protein [Synergistaceae bacterium]|jgi:molecular chaperone DnaK (HSP70)|nr:Hsp70 family protein [Synergistaceae bacterium]